MLGSLNMKGGLNPSQQLHPLYWIQYDNDNSMDPLKNLVQIMAKFIVEPRNTIWLLETRHKDDSSLKYISADITIDEWYFAPLDNFFKITTCLVILRNLLSFENTRVGPTPCIEFNILLKNKHKPDLHTNWNSKRMWVC